MTTFKVVSLFPHIIESYTEYSIIKRAIENKIIKIENYNLRDFSEDKHKKVDDYPYGGGAGMVLGPQPLYKAIRSIKKKADKVVFLTAGGRRLDTSMAREFAGFKSMLIVCGHYEGIDRRVVDEFADFEVSIGDYVLTGGEIAAIVFMDAILRFVDGVLGNRESITEESFNNGLVEYDQYTRPEVFENRAVPKELLSGNHKMINGFRHYSSIKNTYISRTEFLIDYRFDSNDFNILKKIAKELYYG